jgi:hypothetical protein
MLRQLAVLLPQSARAGWAVSSARGFATLNTEDPVVMKQFIGLTDALGYEPKPREKLAGMLQQLLDSVKGIPESSDYRKAVEATAQYRLKVLEQNESSTAVEEVLDAHMEELILETKEELALVPIMAGARAPQCAAQSAAGPPPVLPSSPGSPGTVLITPPCSACCPAGAR